jgi:hypothetical protein
MVYKYFVPTSQKTQHVCAKKTDQLMLFKEMNTVYCEKHTSHIKPPSGCKMRRILAMVFYTPGVWVGPTASVDDLKKRESSCPSQDMNIELSRA